MDTEPDETFITKEGAVQRWDRPDGMTFRLDLWSVEDDEEVPEPVDETPQSAK